MDEESERPDLLSYSTRVPSPQRRQEFRPVEIETTHELDLTGLNDEEAQALRARAFDISQTDAIVNDVLGVTSSTEAEPRIIFLRIRWGKFLQFPQVIRPLVTRAGEEGAATQDVLKETLTRVYQVEASGPETAGEPRGTSRRR